MFDSDLSVFIELKIFLKVTNYGVFYNAIRVRGKIDHGFWGSRGNYGFMVLFYKVLRSYFASSNV